MIQLHSIGTEVNLAPKVLVIIITEDGAHRARAQTAIQTMVEMAVDLTRV